MYYVYILRLNDDRMYVGRSSDLRKRFLTHQQGQVKSTKGALPVKLIYYEAYLIKKDTILRERFLKTSSGRKQIKNQLKHTIDFRK